MKVCLEPGCPNIQPESRCLEHRRQRERERGSASARGYDGMHRAIRGVYETRMSNGERFNCWRCGKPIDPGAPWDLGHDDHDRTKYRGPEHVGRECPEGGNRATSGRRISPGA